MVLFLQFRKNNKMENFEHKCYIQLCNHTGNRSHILNIYVYIQVYLVMDIHGSCIP